MRDSEFHDQIPWRWDVARLQESASRTLFFGCAAPIVQEPEDLWTWFVRSVDVKHITINNLLCLVR